jgi:hypothetical protein
VAADDGGRLLTHTDLVGAGMSAAEQVGLQAGGRLVTNVNPLTREGMPPALLAPLVTGSSVVLVINADAQRRSAIAKQERVTRELWLDA